MWKSFLTGVEDLDRAVEALWHDDLRLFVVTLGGGWLPVLHTPDQGQVQGFNVQAVDTTGAGDGFVAGLLMVCSITRQPGKDHVLRDVCRVANAVGALTTTQRGAIPALPTKSQVEAFLQAAEPGYEGPTNKASLG